MTDFLIGERMIDRLIRDEAASTTSRITNGKPLDSGAAMRLRSDLAHLCRERCRPLVASFGTGGAGSAATYQNSAALFSPLRDAGFREETTDVLVISGARALPWDPRVSEIFPSLVIVDRQNTEGRPTLCSVRMGMDITVDATNDSSSVAFAITLHDDPLRLRDGDHLAFWGSGELSSGDQIVEATLSSDRAITPADYDFWPARPADYAHGDTDCGALHAYLWFGWKFIGVGTGNSINSMWAHESRIDPP